MRRGQQHSPESRALMSANRKGKGTGPRPPVRQVTCVICGTPIIPEPGRRTARRLTCSDECRTSAAKRTAADVQFDLGHIVWEDWMILDALRADARRRGRPPTWKEWLKRERAGGRPGTAAVRRHFGSWNAALKAADLSTRAQHGTRWKRATIIRLLQRDAKRLGRTPTSAEWEAAHDRPWRWSIRRIFGSWTAALEAAGLPPSPVPSGEQHYAAKLTVEAVRAIRASSESIYVTAKRYGVSKSTVSLIRRRETWKHV